MQSFVIVTKTIFLQSAEVAGCEEKKRWTNEKLYASNNLGRRDASFACR